MYLNKKVITIIVAAGKGSRMNSNISKQYINIESKSIISRTIEKFENNKFVDSIILVADEKEIRYFEKDIDSKYKKIIAIVNGGNSRMHSVYNGLCSVSEKNSIVLIHDGVRPFISQKIINKSIVEGHKNNACIPGVKIIDTVKVNNDGFVETTIDRSTLIAVQTPQVFNYKLIKECYFRAIEENFSATDDASIVENYGYKVKIIEGERENIKITTQLDLKIAEAIIKNNNKTGV